MSLALAATSAASGWRKLHHANAALLGLATAATLSKGGLLSLAVGVVLYALLDPRLPRTRRRALLGAMLAGALGVLLLAWHFDWCATAPWLRGRLFLWRVALSLASEHPLTGVGLAGYVAEYGRAAATLLQRDPALFMPLSSVDFAHNDVLQFAAEGGALSAAAFVLVGMQALRRAARREGDALARAAGAALAAIYVDGLADSPLREPATFALFFFLLGWLAPAAPATPTAMPLPRARRGVAALLALVGLLSALQGIRYTAGHLLWTRGRDAFKDDRSAAAAAIALTDLSRARFYLPEHGRIASHYTLALTRTGQWHAALEASKVTNSLHFDFDDQMLERDIEADLLSPEGRRHRLVAGLRGALPAAAHPTAAPGRLVPGKGRCRRRHPCLPARARRAPRLSTRGPSAGAGAPQATSVRIRAALRRATTDRATRLNPRAGWWSACSPACQCRASSEPRK